MLRRPFAGAPPKHGVHLHKRLLSQHAGRAAIGEHMQSVKDAARSCRDRAHELRVVPAVSGQVWLDDAE